MSWPATYSPFTVPSKSMSGTQRARIQRVRPCASITSRSYETASPDITRFTPSESEAVASPPRISSLRLPITSSRL